MLVGSLKDGFSEREPSNGIDAFRKHDPLWEFFSIKRLPIMETTRGLDASAAQSVVKSLSIRRDEGSLNAGRAVLHQRPADTGHGHGCYSCNRPSSH